MIALGNPWIWINEPQHAIGIQAVAGIFATIAAIAAGIFAGAVIAQL
jgi:ABC-type phosphate transport system auxiliary subunit